MLLTYPETVELVKLVPAERQARFYRLAIWPDLFGGFSLAREYGRIGQDGRLRLDHHPDIDAAGRAFARLFGQKRRGGYAPLIGRPAE
jgi:predicted DNA-binding WGR domain protein